MTQETIAKLIDILIQMNDNIPYIDWVDHANVDADITDLAEALKEESNG